MPDNIVATTLAVPEPPPLQGVAAAHSDPLSYVISAAGGVLAASFWFRRKLSRDSTEIVKDRAEADLVRVLTLERDKAMAEAREAWARRTADAEQIATLRLENEYLQRDVKRLSEEMQELKESVEILRGALTRITGKPPSAPTPLPI